MHSATSPPSFNSNPRFISLHSRCVLGEVLGVRALTRPLHSADIRCHTSPSGGVHTYMHIPKYVLAITNPFIAFPCHCHLPSRHASPLSWTTNSQCPGTTPISHRVSKLETHIFVIITHLGAQVDSWVCRGRRFDERETAALVLVVSRTWGGEALWRVRTYALHHHSFLFQTDPIYKRGFSQIRSFDKHCTEYICTSIGLGTIPFRLLLCFSKQPRYIWIIKERKVGSNMSLIHLPGEGNPLHISAGSPSQRRRLPSSCSPTK